jgi:hypothetical protein
MIETVRVDRWLYQTLSQDTVLGDLVHGRIYGYLAPPGATLPYVVYSHQSGRDVRALGPTRIMTDMVYQIKAIGSGGSFAPLKSIVDRLDDLLQGAAGVVIDPRSDIMTRGLAGQLIRRHVLMCVREQPIAYVEVEDGMQYRHLGGLWRIIAQ